jgi:hypothetical protein
MNNITDMNNSNSNKHEYKKIQRPAVEMIAMNEQMVKRV